MSTFQYTNREGETWRLANITPTILPGFWEASRHTDGRRVVIHQDRIKRTKEDTTHALLPRN